MKLKSYHCIRCKDIFSTKRRYGSYGSIKICDECLRPNIKKKSKYETISKLLNKSAVVSMFVITVVAAIQ